MKKLTLEQHGKTMRDDWFIMKEDGKFNTGKTMMGDKMLHAISGDATGVCPKDESLTEKNLLVALRLSFGIDYEDAEMYCDLFNEIREVIDSVR